MNSFKNDEAVTNIIKYNNYIVIFTQGLIHLSKDMEHIINIIEKEIENK